MTDGNDHAFIETCAHCGAKYNSATRGKLRMNETFCSIKCADQAYPGFNPVKTKLTYSEAKAAAFKEFPPEIFGGWIAGYMKEDRQLGDLVLGLIMNKAVYVEGEGYKIPKRREVQAKVLEAHHKAEETWVLDKWAAANNMQRYQVGDQVWYECWKKSENKY